MQWLNCALHRMHDVRQLCAAVCLLTIGAAVVCAQDIDCSLTDDTLVLGNGGAPTVTNFTAVLLLLSESIRMSDMARIVSSAAPLITRGFKTSTIGVVGVNRQIALSTMYRLLNAKIVYNGLVSPIMAIIVPDATIINSMLFPMGLHNIAYQCASQVKTQSGASACVYRPLVPIYTTPDLAANIDRDVTWFLAFQPSWRDVGAGSRVKVDFKQSTEFTQVISFEVSKTVAYDDTIPLVVLPANCKANSIDDVDTKKVWFDDVITELQTDALWVMNHDICDDTDSAVGWLIGRDGAQNTTGMTMPDPAPTGFIAVVLRPVLREIAQTIRLHIIALVGIMITFFVTSIAALGLFFFLKWWQQPESDVPQVQPRPLHHGRRSRLHAPPSPGLEATSIDQPRSLFF